MTTATLYSAERGLPASVDAERAILGACMLSPEAYDSAASLGLVAEDMSLDAHRRIYRVIAEMREAGRHADSLTVVQELKDRGELEGVGDVAYVASLADGIPQNASIKSHVKIVREKSRLRKLIHASNRCIASAYEGEASASCISNLSEGLLQIQTDTDDPPARSAWDVSNTAYNEWEELANSEKDPIGLTTGVRCLDLATSGIRPGEFWIIGGRTGDGKTSLALQIAAANCREEVPVGVFSIEMRQNDLLQRLWSHHRRIPFQNIRRPRGIDSETKAQIRRACGEVAKWPLYLHDGALTLAKLQAKVRLLIRQQKIQVVIVDYVQIIDVPAKDERERITKCSNALRVLAKDTGVPVVALSQLSRPKDGNPNTRPHRFSLKESGSLENDAHVVIIPYRPVDEMQCPIDHEAELVIVKQRHGSPGPEAVYFDASTFTFRDRERVKRDSEMEYAAGARNR